MDLQAALAHASNNLAANVVGLQIHGRTIEVYRPRFRTDTGKCLVEYREGQLFHDQTDHDTFESECLPEDAAEIDYFVAPLSDTELDSVIDQNGEVILHRLLEGAPDPHGCDSPREKAAFTSWCISRLAQQSG